MVYYPGLYLCDVFRMKTVTSVATPKTERSKLGPGDRNSYSSSSRKSLAASACKSPMLGVCTVCFEEADTRLVVRKAEMDVPGFEPGSLDRHSYRVVTVVSVWTACGIF